MILHIETFSVGAPDYVTGLMGGYNIGLPPVLHFGSEELKSKVLPECMLGKKKICLCISDFGAGSDVANIHCKAVLSEDKK